MMPDTGQIDGILALAINGILTLAVVTLLTIEVGRTNGLRSGEGTSSANEMMIGSVSSRRVRPSVCVVVVTGRVELSTVCALTTAAPASSRLSNEHTASAQGNILLGNIKRELLSPNKISSCLGVRCLKVLA